MIIGIVIYLYFLSCSVMEYGFILMFVVYPVLLFLESGSVSLCWMLCFCLIYNACSLRCSWCIFALLCRCCLVVSCVYPVAVHNAALCVV